MGGKACVTTAWFLQTMNRCFNLMYSRHSVMAISKFGVDKYAEAVEFLKFVVTFRVSRRPREMYCGHARLCV